MADENVQNETYRRELRRSRTNRVIFGVCGGLGDYLAIDPVLLRVVFLALLVLLPFAGLLAYIVLAIIIPAETTASGAGSYSGGEEPVRSRSGAILVGAGLIVLGGLILVSNLNLLWWLDVGRLWPLLLVALGVALIIRREGD